MTNKQIAQIWLVTLVTIFFTAFFGTLMNLEVAGIYRDDGTIILAPGSAPITQDNGEFVQFIQPQVEAALTPITNSTDQIPAIKKNTNLIPALL